MEVKLTTLSKNHSDRDGDLIPEFDDGIDNLEVSIPAGKKFSRLALVKECFLGDCHVLRAPDFGATGRQRLDVKWNYASFGKANYDLKVYVVDRDNNNQPLIITFGSENWEERARGAINAGRRVRIKVTGPQALLLYPLIWGRGSRELLNEQEKIMRSGDDISIKQKKLAKVAGVDDAVVITAIICATIIATAIFITLGVIIKNAIDAGKCANANTEGIDLLAGHVGGVSIDIADCDGNGRVINEMEEEKMDQEVAEAIGYSSNGNGTGFVDLKQKFNSFLEEAQEKFNNILEEVQESKKKQVTTP